MKKTSKSTNLPIQSHSHSHLPSPSHSKSNSVHSRFQLNLSTEPDSILPLAYHHHHHHHSTTTTSQSILINLKSLLFSRSRITNLAVIILTITLIISLYFNLIDHHHHQTKNFSSLDISSSLKFTSIQNTLSQPRTHLKQLIIVPGHAIFIGKNPLSPEDWLLEPYQSNSSIITFINHIKEGIKLSLIRKDALLIYSGGQTRLKSNSSLSESTSYSNVANSLNLYQVIYDQLLEERQLDRHQRFRIHEFLTDRVTTEEFALDSWTNLVFSVARFKEFTGHYPHHITVIGHSFKSKRFQEIHREALRWPTERFEYVSIQDDSIQLESRYLGEKEVFQSFGFDRYGCLGKLMSKRISRNPFRRFHSYLISNYELTGLLEWCPANGIDWYPGPLPWSNLT